MPLGVDACLLRALVQVDSPEREQGDTPTQRLRRDEKFIVVEWMNLASRSIDEMNPTAHSDDVADYWNLNHMKRPPEMRNNHDEDEARDLDFDPQDNAQRAEDEGRSMMRDEGEASENTSGPDVEKKESKTRNKR